MISSLKSASVKKNHKYPNKIQITGINSANKHFYSLTLNNFILRKTTMQNYKLIIFQLIFLSLISCSKDKNTIVVRNDYATKLEINLPGSLQNPAFSPDGKTIVFTHFRNGYNKPPSDLYTYNLETKALKPLITDGNSNVNLPGACWNGVINSIVFSSERGNGDQIYAIADNTTAGYEVQITTRPDSIAFEPTFSPDGKWIVFETHKLDEENNGVITKYKPDGSSGYINLTTLGEDNKQPNWSPAGDKILYQKEENGQWDIWLMNIDGSNKTRITNFAGSKTDAVFSHNGEFIIFSTENNEVELANIYKVAISGGNPVRLTNYSGYDGAPSISPDGTKIIFESAAGDPDKSSGTTLWLLNL